MAIILLDTSVIIDHLNGRSGRTEFLEQLVQQGQCPCLLPRKHHGGICRTPTWRGGWNRRFDRQSGVPAVDPGNRAPSRSIAPRLAGEGTNSLLYRRDYRGRRFGQPDTPPDGQSQAFPGRRFGAVALTGKRIAPPVPPLLIF